MIVVEAVLAGPNGQAVVRLVLDTGAALTTVAPQIAAAIGHSSEDRVARSVVRSAVAEEHGYVVRLPRFTALGVTLSDVHANIADLGPDIDGLLGMNFLSEFNFEIRPGERRVLVEKLAP